METIVMANSLARNRPPLGGQALVAVDRAIAELRRGAPVIVGDGAAAAIVLAAETAEREGLGRLLALCGGSACLALTARRAAALGLIPQGSASPSGSVATLAVSAAGEADGLRRLADPAVDLAGVPAAYRFRLSAGGEGCGLCPRRDRSGQEGAPSSRRRSGHAARRARRCRQGGRHAERKRRGDRRL